MGRFDGRRALVTGAAGGLGSALCLRLVAEGAHVIGSDIGQEKLGVLARKMPDGAGMFSPVEIDQSDPEAARQSVTELVEQHGTIDSLVNNASTYPKSTAEHLSAEQFLNVLSINAVAASTMLSATVPGMREAGFGRIVNVASVSFDIGLTELSAYVASKGALIGMARVWARELGGQDITANCISPGAFQTDAEKIHPDPEGYSQYVLDRQAIKRRGTPDDFAHAVMFLLERSSGFITGQNILVDGGWVSR